MSIALGRGRKMCPDCKEVVGSPTRVCKCGHDFVSGKKVATAPAADAPAKTIQTYDEAGRGRKQCDGCGKYIHYSYIVCACGHQFEKKDKTAAPATVKPAEPVSAKPTVVAAPVSVKTAPDHRHPPIRSGYESGMLHVHTPAGDCPVRLKGTDADAVVTWADAVRQHYRERHQFLSTAGLLYFARKTWGDNPGFDAKSDEYAIVRGHILQFYGNS